eukprot:TRINITY_DN4143_c0_g3_i2.p1 TRINITY_DN4143_c0_g3~~TRINITY_DN4143_c0_g3_i2.p1  ORF type:complete len:227 (-),score=29.61 TRINITY_DN4143_c0_g3_i2:83-763(-)
MFWRSRHIFSLRYKTKTQKKKCKPRTVYRRCTTQQQQQQQQLQQQHEETMPEYGPGPPRSTVSIILAPVVISSGMLYLFSQLGKKEAIKDWHKGVTDFKNTEVSGAVDRALTPYKWGSYAVWPLVWSFCSPTVTYFLLATAFYGGLHYLYDNLPIEIEKYPSFSDAKLTYSGLGLLFLVSPIVTKFAFLSYFSSGQIALQSYASTVALIRECKKENNKLPILGAPL